MTEPFCRLLQGHVLDVLRGVPEASVHCVVTSPPYLWLRDYGTDPQVWGGDRECEHAWGSSRKLGRGSHGGRDLPGHDPEHQAAQQAVATASTGSFCKKCGAWRGSLGLEPMVDLYVSHMVEIFREVWRVLRDDGTLWLNLGDCYAGGGNGGGGSFAKDGIREAEPGTDKNVAGRTGSRGVGYGLKAKDLVGVPWRVALALQADGWYLRRDIIWNKPNPMPESVTDRPSTAHEYVFLLTKSARYFYDADAVRERASYLQPNAPDKIKSPYGQGFSRRPSETGSTFKRENSKRGVPQAGANNGTHRPDREPTSYNGPERNLRSVWTLATAPFPEAHFATFPPKLPETCIKAGTSEKGCCSTCGAPWARCSEVEYVNPGNRSTNGPRSADRKHQDFGTAGYAVRKERRSTTTGWKPTCACPPADPAPCTVLDIFNGAGTTGMVAARLGRSYIGIDLNAEYVEMARSRIEGDAPLLNRVEAP